MSLVAGMLAGADSIDDMELLRHGAMDKVFDRVRAPSTLGTFLRGFRFGHVRQFDAVAARALIWLAVVVPGILAGSGGVVMLDIDDTVKPVFGSFVNVGCRMWTSASTFLGSNLDSYTVLYQATPAHKLSKGSVPSKS